MTSPQPVQCGCSHDFGVVPEPINEYAVVCYIPEQLGEFITNLRQELIQGCTAKSHVTILPPRPLADPSAALAQLRAAVKGFTPFEIHMPRLSVFRETSVIYIEIESGSEILTRMHEQLNVGPFHHCEKHQYHPHVTLAQGLDQQTVGECFDRAVRLWNQSVPSQRVLIDNLTFVQNTNVNRWLDLDLLLLPARSDLTRTPTID